MSLRKILKTVEFDHSLLRDLEKFCDKCAKYNYLNNKDINAIKLDWCLNQGGQFFLTYHHTDIVSMSGCHPLPQIGSGFYRAMFREVTLPEYQNIDKLITKTHMNSIPFFDHLPLQINWAKSKGYDNVVITTNINNPKIESMTRNHRVFQLLEKQNIVECLHRDIDLFNTAQSVWQINRDQYFKTRKEYGTRNGLD